MATLFHSGTPDDVLLLALRDHSDPAVRELRARYIPFVGIDLDDVVARDDHEGALAAKDEELEAKDAVIKKYKAALVRVRSELVTLSSMLGKLSDKIAGGLDETV